MAYQDLIQYITLTGNSGNDFPAGAIDVTAAYVECYIDGAGATSGSNYSILPTGTPNIGTRVVIRYFPTFVKNGWLFEIFGSTISDNQLLYAFTVTAVWTGVTWYVQIDSSDLTGTTTITSDMILSLDGVKVQVNTMDADRILDGTITNVKIAPATIDLSTKAVALSLDNSIIANSTINASQKVVANTVTNTELATMADLTIKGNISGGVASPSDIPITTNKYATNAKN